MQAWDRDTWDTYDAEIDVAFHGRKVFLTPLLNYVNMPSGSDTYYTGNEMLGSHVNHNSIGLRQRFIDATYVDMRRKKLVSSARYGGKCQLWEFDELVSQFGKGTPAFMMAVLKQRMMAGVIETHEKIARDAIFKWAQFRFLADGSAWAAGTADWSTLAASSSYQVQVEQIEDTKLRMAERTVQFLQEFGTFAEPVPNFPMDSLVMTTPNVMYDIWTSESGQWLQDIRQMQDQRVINGGVARYRGVTFVENPWLVLYNGGPISKQVGVTSAINWGDGAPDPDTEDAVDNVYLVGQSSADIVHYVQCSSFSAGDFAAGDRVTIHVQRTADYGVTNGCDVFDGESYEAVVYSVDATNNQVKFTEPITQAYTASFTGTPDGGSSATLYAYITLARNIHPILVIGSRGMATFAARTKIRYHTPVDVEADLPGVLRASWDEYGQANRWNPYIYEVIYAVASDTRSGRSAVSLR